MKLAAFLLFAGLFTVFCDELKVPKRYKINLDLPPEERWNEVIDDHIDEIPAVVNETKLLHATVNKCNIKV